MEKQNVLSPLWALADLVSEAERSSRHTVNCPSFCCVFSNLSAACPRHAD